MYYEEKTINGQLHYKNHNSQWTPFTTHMLNKRIIELEERLLAEFNKNKDTDEEIENYKGVKSGIRNVFERLGNPGGTFNHKCVVNNL